MFVIFYGICECRFLGNVFNLKHSGKGYIISSIKESASDLLVIPPYFNGLSIYEIDCEAFKCFEGSCVYISNTIESINRDAFIRSNIEKVVFEKNSQLKIIGSEAFSYTKLKEVIIPKSVEIIASCAFAGCGLQSLSFEDGSKIQNIGSSAFSDSCFSSVSLNFKNAVIRIEAFANNDNLHTVNLQQSDNLRLEYNIFRNCPNLTTIIPPTYGFKYHDNSFPSAELTDSVRLASLFQ